MSDTAMLAKIRALLAKAESSTFEGERESYQTKASELIARYGIDEALLAAQENRDETVERRRIHVEAPYHADKGSLLNSLYLAMGCQVILVSKRNGQTFEAFGFRSDLDRAEILYTSLLIQMIRSAERDVSPYCNWTGRKLPHQTQAANKRAFMSGFTYSVVSRVKDAEARAKKAATAAEAPSGAGTALVLRDRSLAVQDAFSAAYPTTKTYKRSLSGSGYGAGRAAGQTADIGQGRVGGNRRALA